MVNKPLSELAYIRSGYQGLTSEGNRYMAVKLTNVNREGSIDFENLTEIECDNMPSRFLLKKNDIIFKAKCAENAAALIEEDLENTVATAHFLVITINDTEQLDPGYLVTYLNSDVAQAYFKANAQGATVPMIRLLTLKELEIKLPSIEKQREIAKAYRLVKQEKATMEQLIQNREKQFKAYLQRVLG